MTWFIVVPKLKVVWSGQNVNIQQELQGHQQHRRDSVNSYVVERRQSWQFPLTLHPNGVVQRRKSLPVENGTEDKDDNFSVSTEGFASRRLLTQIVSTMNIYGKICDATTSRIVLSKNDWDTLKVRTSALYKQISKIKFSWDESAPENIAPVESELHDISEIVGSPSINDLIPQQVSTLSSASSSCGEESIKGNHVNEV